MGFPLNEEVLKIVRELVVKLTGFKEDSDIFKYTYQHAVNQLQKADSLAFVTENEINKKVTGLSDKFMFHGFMKPGQDFVALYEKFMGKGTPKDEVRNRLNVMKFMFCLSENPTSYLASLPEHLQSIAIDQEEEIDWKSYLWEGVDRWSPPPDTESDEWTDEECDCVDMQYENNGKVPPTAKERVAEIEFKTTLNPPGDEFNATEKLQKLKDSVQHGWFNVDSVRMLPTSNHPETNVALAWEKHIENLTFGLVDNKKVNIISEYKVVREVIFQFWNTHNSTCFKLSGNNIIPRDDITISSCRPVALQNFLYEFVPYIDLLQFFRTFEAELLGSNPADCSSLAPSTYRSYNCSLNNIIHPTMKALVDLENDIMKQDETVTLLKLAHICENMFKPIKQLKVIHNRVVMDYRNNNPFKCTTSLLLKLYEGIRNPDGKMAQDIYFSLYLESLYTYMGIIDNWLSKGDFTDTCGEFPITAHRRIDMDENISLFSWESEDFVELNEESDGWHFVYKVNDDCDNKDPLFKVISKRVLQIGKNIHLLRKLGKLHLVNDFEKPSESLYDEFVREMLSNISTRFGDNTSNENHTAVKVEEKADDELYKFPAVCSDFCKFRTEMDKLDNLADTEDPFIKAFESFLMDESEEEMEDKKCEESLYSRISKLTTFMFPAVDLIEMVFTKILHKRYGGCVRTVKNLLKYDYQLDEHLELMKQVFLFKDGILAEFHKSLFMKIENEQKWGVDIVLTSHLQDILIDIHPELYDRVTIIVDEAWTDFIDDPLKSTALFKINIKVKNPINIIIQPFHIKLYNDIFFFIFRIKWGLYMLSNLLFKDINFKETNRTKTIIIRRLQILRFGLLNIFTLILHYLMDHIFGNYLMEMEERYNNANDLDTLVDSHDTFIRSIYQHVSYLRKFNENSHGVYMLLYLVKKLCFVWKDISQLKITELEKLEKNYEKCYDNLMPIIYYID